MRRNHNHHCLWLPCVRGANVYVLHISFWYGISFLERKNTEWQVNWFIKNDCKLFSSYREMDKMDEIRMNEHRISIWIEIQFDKCVSRITHHLSRFGFPFSVLRSPCTDTPGHRSELTPKWFHMYECSDIATSFYIRSTFYMSVLCMCTRIVDCEFLSLNEIWNIRVEWFT